MTKMVKRLVLAAIENDLSKLLHRDVDFLNTNLRRKISPDTFDYYPDAVYDLVMQLSGKFGPVIRAQTFLKAFRNRYHRKFTFKTTQTVQAWNSDQAEQLLTMGFGSLEEYHAI